MATELVVLGPPGTGKTTAGIRISREWLGEVGKDELAYLAFSKAAADEALYRIVGGDWGGRDEEYPYFRTIHSLAYRGLRSMHEGVEIVTPASLKQFAKESGFDGAYMVVQSEDIAEVYSKLEHQGRTWCDQAMLAYYLSRISAATADELDRARKKMSPLACGLVGFLSEPVYRGWVEKYEEFKEKNGLVDFTDMLTHALTLMPTLDGCRRVVIDEAQDLCPLHYAIIDRLFEGAEQVVWIGDDDQSIYKFAGASAELFLARAARSRYQITLRQTHRFGQQIVDFSKKISQRITARAEKDVIGVSGREHKITVSGEFRPRTGKSLILHRHILGCQEVAKKFVESGMPFRNERGRDPLALRSRVKAWEALDSLAKGESVLFGAAKVLIEDLMPSLVIEEGHKLRLVVHGAKGKLDDARLRETTLTELVAGGILTDEGAGTVKTRAYRRLRHADDLEYYSRVSANGHSLDADEAPTITTIHGAKGRQAGSVTIFNEASQRCWRDADTEHRLAYVAATRTTGGVEVCVERQLKWAKTPYEYPVPK